MTRKKEWTEGEIALAFGLHKIEGSSTPLMQEWLKVSNPKLEDWEQKLFDRIFQKAHRLRNWSEEDLKMKFITYILDLGKLTEDDKFLSFFDKRLSAEVGNYHLSVVSDFILAKGLMDYMEKPYFHFQEYKPSKNPTGDSMAQLLEAFLIGQKLNENSIAIYGCEVIGKDWRFVILEDKEYCVSKAYDASEKDELLKIIAILRKFRKILETQIVS